MQDVVSKLIAFVLRFLPENGKTFLAAAVAALLAANAALLSNGVIFLPENVTVVLGWIAVALGLIGLRHGQMKTEDAVTGKKLFNGVGRRFGVIALFLLLPFMSGCEMGDGGRKGACFCCPNCPCGTDCGCCPGNKCALLCQCRKGDPKPVCPAPCCPE